MRLEHELHNCDIKPAIEFAANLSFNPKQFESNRAVQRERTFATRFNSGDHTVEAALAGSVTDRREQLKTNSPTMVLAVDIDRVFNSR